jgi:P4 family phage/plasmid primase-like protien
MADGRVVEGGGALPEGGGDAGGKGLEIRGDPLKGRKWLVEAWLDGALIHSDVLDPHEAAARARFARAVVAKCEARSGPGVVEAGVVGDRVMAAAARPAEGRAAPTGLTNPTRLAALYFEYLEAAAGAARPGGARVVHYHNGQFYLWGRAWQPVGAEEMRARVVGFLVDHAGVERVTAKLAKDVLVNLQGLSLVEHGDMPLPFVVEDYGPPTVVRPGNRLAFANGLLDLDGLARGHAPALAPHDPRWFSTSILPFAFDPAARCPRFERFLADVLERDPATGRARQPGDCRLEVLQEWFGYTLLPDGRFQKFLIMVGAGNNGKGVIQNLWVRMLGPENVAHVGLDQLNGRFGLWPLLGKMANICGDLCEIDGVAEGVLKRLTGQDNITVDRKNLRPVTLAPAVKLVFATNTLPRFNDKTRGVWRRLGAMPFRVVVPEEGRDERLTETLTEELPGILNWALRGLERLVRAGGFTPCEVCGEAGRAHEFDCDPVAQFLDESGLYPPPDAAARWITKKELYRRYGEWCEENGHSPLSSGRFKRQVERLPGVRSMRAGAPDGDSRRPYQWHGIGNPIPSPPE